MGSRGVSAACRCSFSHSARSPQCFSLVSYTFEWLRFFILVLLHVFGESRTTLCNGSQCIRSDSDRTLTSSFVFSRRKIHRNLFSLQCDLPCECRFETHIFQILESNVFTRNRGRCHCSGAGADGHVTQRVHSGLQGRVWKSQGGRGRCGRERQELVLFGRY